MDYEATLDPLDGLNLDELRMLALTSNEHLAAMFPGRICITPEELAQAWKGKTTKGVVQHIRRRLKEGTLIPGLKRDGGRWNIPVPAVANVLDDLTRNAEAARRVRVVGVSSSPPANKKRRGTNIGPRPGIMGYASDVWTAVYEALDTLWAHEERDAIMALMPSKPVGREHGPL
jgi:hypothetical protein